jgi:hypothetical protein
MALYLLLKSLFGIATICFWSTVSMLQGIAKFDLATPPTQKEACIATIEWDSARGGEAFFVPRSQDPAQCNGESLIGPCTTRGRWLLSMGGRACCRWLYAHLMLLL